WCRWSRRTYERKDRPTVREARPDEPERYRAQNTHSRPPEAAGDNHRGSGWTRSHVAGRNPCPFERKECGGAEPPGFRAADGWLPQTPPDDATPGGAPLFPTVLRRSGST